MSKNRKFKNSYLVTIEGSTNNGAQASLFDSALRGLSGAFSVEDKSSSVSINIISTEGDYNTESHKVVLKEKK